MRIFAIFFVLAGAVFAQTKPLITSELGGRELSFLHKANEHSIVMQRLAELGKTKGQSEPVRALGDLLGTTQSKEHDQLLALAVTKGVSFSTPGLPKTLQDTLAATDDSTFDRVWLEEVSNVVKVMIQNCTTASASADKEIKKFADDTVALAEQKLGVIKKIASR